MKNYNKRRLRRRCFNCRKRVNLKIVKIDSVLYIKCPNCLGQAKWKKKFFKY